MAQKMKRIATISMKLGKESQNNDYQFNSENILLLSSAD
jgi:hypothetical protein